MIFLISLVILCLAGIAAVFWLLKNEQESAGILTEEPAEKDTPAPPPPPKPIFTALFRKKKQAPAEKTKPLPKKKLTIPSLSSFANKSLLSKIKFWEKKKEKRESPKDEEAESFSSLKEYFGNNNDAKEEGKPAPSTGTAAIKTAPAAESDHKQPLTEAEEKSIDKEIELSTELTELKEKYAKLETLFNEKNTALEKAQESLENELKNRKEFNKIKDVLEKELKDIRDKGRNSQVELTNSESEAERHKKRIAMLEEKITRLEKDLMEREDKIDELVKRLQTFASPPTAAAPPQKEEPDPVEEKPPAEKPPGEPPAQEISSSPGQPSQPEQEALNAPKEKDIENQPGSESNTEQPASAPEEPQPAQPQEKQPGETEPSDEEKETTPVEERTPPANEDPAPPAEEDSQESENQPQDEPFLKLEPDVISGDDQNSPVTQNPGDQSTREPTKPTTDQNTNNEKE